MAITNLTGTTWVFDGFSVEYLTDSYNISFQSNGNSYIKYEWEADTVGEDEYDIYWVKYYSSESSFIYAYQNGDWTNEAYATITITGGTDATSSSPYFADLLDFLEANATQVVEGGSISVGNSSISKSFAGSSEVSKMILNGSTIYEKQAPTGFSGTVTNTGYIPAAICVDKSYDSEADYEISSDETATFSCNYFYMVYSYYEEYSVITATNCSYENVSADPIFGYKVIPTADNWVFTADFRD